MPQEQYNRDGRNNPPRFNRQPGDDPNQPPRKGPKFSIYWIYAIILAVLIGTQIWGGFSPNMAESDSGTFKEMLSAGDVSKFTIISNRNTVRVYLKKEAIPKYEGSLKK